MNDSKIRKVLAEIMRLIATMEISELKSLRTFLSEATKHGVQIQLRRQEDSLKLADLVRDQAVRDRAVAVVLFSMGYNTPDKLFDLFSKIAKKDAQKSLMNKEEKRIHDAFAESPASADALDEFYGRQKAMSPAELGILAAKIPGCSAEEFRDLKAKFIAGFYGRQKDAPNVAPKRASKLARKKKSKRPN